MSPLALYTSLMTKGRKITMAFIPEDESKNNSSVNLAPMIDFLFLMLMFFACLAITRVTTRDTDIALVDLEEEVNSVATTASTDLKILNISITENGDYKWVTELRDYRLNTADAIRDELLNHYAKGLLPKDFSKTQVLLKIDRNARWEPIMQAIFAIRDAGFDVRPVYEPKR